ncbi:MAG: hypothetical protein US22_C0004G0018 [candidate division TM6 bacterium GW2011_GWF2_36_6]|nr:MAG: hypothetical protein US22_C0004G0018 [candidate division TM6 bacterium GW2011_GWF2_36_6]
MPGYSLQDAQKNLDYITNQIETIDYSSFLIDIDISYQTIFDIFNIIVYNACAKDKRIPPNIITNKLIIDETNFVLFALQRNPKKCNPSNFYKLLLSSLQSIILNHTHLLGLSDAVNKLQEELINSIASSTTQSLNNLEALMEQSPFFDDYRESIIQQTMQRASTPTISL